jgi:DNA-binding response OmpR family regulator
VLVVDDEALAVMLVEDELARAGHRLAGPFATCADALSWLGTQTPDAAILDLVLQDGPCTQLAIELTRRGVPFLVFSGSAEESAPKPFRNAPWIAKPSSLDRLVPLLEKLVSARVRRPVSPLPT